MLRFVQCFLDSKIMQDNKFDALSPCYVSIMCVFEYSGNAI